MGIATQIVGLITSLCSHSLITPHHGLAFAGYDDLKSKNTTVDWELEFSGAPATSRGLRTQIAWPTPFSAVIFDRFSGDCRLVDVLPITFPLVSRA